MNFSYSQEIKEYYSEWWDNPKDIRNVVFQRLYNHIRGRIPPGNGKRALDIASGHGRFVSYLLEKGYEVVAVEFNEDFVTELKRKFPTVHVICEDIRNYNFTESFDIITCIGFLQLLHQNDLPQLLERLAKVTGLLLADISNRNSFHARWIEFRGFKNRFVFNYTPSGFKLMLQQAGFDLVHTRGIGLITPVTLFRGFRGKLIPCTVASAINKLDILMPNICHLYYVEASRKES